MNDDLRDALDAIADGATAAADRRTGSGGLPAPGALVEQARRRRRRFQTQATGVGLAASLAVGVAGVTVADTLRDEPEPPAAVHATRPAYTDALPACGAVTEDTLLREVDPSWWASSALEGSPTTVDAELAARVQLSPREGYTEVTGTARGTALLLVRDGVVVGRAEAGGAEQPVATTADEPTAIDVAGVVTPCGDAVLTDGTYELWPAVEVRLESFSDGSGMPSIADSVFGWLVTGPHEVRLTAGWADVDAADLPGDVPLVEGRVLRARANADGVRWEAVVSAELPWQQVLPQARQLMLEAGFTANGGAIDAESGERLGYTFVGGGWEVELQGERRGDDGVVTYTMRRTGTGAPPLAPTPTATATATATATLPEDAESPASSEGGALAGATPPAEPLGTSA